MDWKEFLKPNWRKFKLFIFIIFLLQLVWTFGMSYTVYYGGHTIIPTLFLTRPFSATGSLLQNATGFSMFLLGDEYPVQNFRLNLYLGVVLILSGVYFAIDIFYCYFISCSIAWIYDRYKKK
jgi:hypothetical protein